MRRGTAKVCLPFWIRNRRKTTINREPSRRSSFAIRYSLREWHNAGVFAPACRATLSARCGGVSATPMEPTVRPVGRRRYLPWNLPPCSFACEIKTATVPPLSVVQEYDVTLKSVLRGSAKLTMRELTGTSVARWLDVELPKVQNAQNPRLDLLAETVDGGLVHVELQSGNDASMPLRMAEYCLGVFRQFKRFPRQIVLYVGEPELRMEKELRGSNVWFAYSLIDIRMLDGERLLASDEVGDNVIAILAGLRDDEGAVCKIVERIAGLAAAERETALAQLTILAGLRHLSKTVAREARKMPIDLDIRDHEVLGPMFIEAEQKGLQTGLHAGELTVLRRQIGKRFGALPGWAGEKLAALSTSELEDLSERLLDAKSLEELLR
jgi:hypothetical protein